MKIDHIAIWSKDLERSRSFYEKYFGAVAGTKYVNPKKHFESYFLAFADGCRLELMQMPGVAENTSGTIQHCTGITHLAIGTGSKQKVDELTALLRKDGHAVVGEPRTTGDGYYESVVLDPDGVRVEITV